MAKLIAMFVRNEMEDFNATHLSDTQMAELNPIIRNAIYTALYCIKHRDDDWWCDMRVAWELGLIPDYWEEPKLVLDRPRGREAQRCRMIYDKMKAQRIDRLG
jgi:hypothetical protein